MGGRKKGGMLKTLQNLMIFYTFQLSSKFRYIPVVPVPLVLALHIVPISNFKCFPFVFARPLLLHLLCKASTQHLTFAQNTSSSWFFSSSPLSWLLAGTCVQVKLLLFPLSLRYSLTLLCLQWILKIVLWLKFYSIL